MREYRPADLLGQLNDVEEKNAPKTLYLAGDEALARGGRRVSIVGSRKPTSAGVGRAQELAIALAGARITVVSGLAKGIDTAAHMGAITGGGHTLAVLGTPLDQSYPASNKALQAEIMRDHLAVSQFPSGYPSQPKNFPIRNRTMALLSDATVIVEAGEKSGTLHQGWEVLRLGRLLFLMESVAENESLSWPTKMIGYGAQVLSAQNLEQFLEEVPERPSGEPVTF